ncbi:MAG: glycosyltransferase family 39 protein [Janthinobacterium lividum]
MTRHVSPDAHMQQKPGRDTIPVLLATLLLTATILLAWGHFKPLDQDEVFVLQTDSVPSLRALIDVQRHTPISLDPLFYHLLGHASVNLFGACAFAVRLPSLLGYLLMQVCLFSTASRLASARAGVIAAAVPALTATLFYGVEARPYGVLLGLSALILLSWQNALLHQKGHRAPALITLALALALALNTHYFAVLLLIPLYTAELFRSVSVDGAKVRLHMDRAMLLAIACGSAGVVFALPFQKAAGEFRKHYYNAGGVSLHAVTQSYRALLVNYTTYSMGVQRALGAVLLLLALLLMWCVWKQFRSPTHVPAAERVFLVVLAALPFFGFLLARFVTHSIEVRYVLPAIVAIAILVALSAEPWLRSSRRYAAVLALLLLAIAAAGVERVRDQRMKQASLLASLVVTPQLQARLLASPAARLYVQNLGFFDEISPYVPDEVRSRMVLLYSREEEISWLHHDTAALTAMHMQHFTSVPTASYEDLQQQPGDHLLLLHPDGWEWVGRALSRDHANPVELGSALGGELVLVHFPARQEQAP